VNIYVEEVMDHYEHPRNQGEMEGPEMEGRETNATCGDMVQFQLRVKKGIVMEVKWKGIGCAVSTAASSKLSEWLKGKRVSEIVKMDAEEITREGVGFEVSPGREKCLNLPSRAVKKITQES